MLSQSSLSAIRILCLASITLALSACGDFAGMVREVTYPPDFHYEGGQELRSRMHQLAYQLQLLEEALAEDDSGQTLQQQKVVGILSEMGRIGSNLQAGDIGPNHPFLQDYMRNFLYDVGQARNEVAQDPPRYYLAGRVSGGCANCHTINR